MPQILIVSPDVKSRLGVPHKKPWMAPGAIGEIGAMVTQASSNWQVIAHDESVKGAVPGILIRESDFLALTFLTPSRYRAIDLADFAKKFDKPVIAGGRDIIGWSREKQGMEQIHEYFPSVCTSTLNSNLMRQILADATNGSLSSRYELLPYEKIQMISPRRDLIEPSRYFAGYTLRSSEGCNLSCPWCTVGGYNHHTKDPADYREEVAELQGKFFLDTADSFASNIDFVFDVVLPENKRSGKMWGTELTVADALGAKSGRSLIEPMRRSGCRLMYFGIENVIRDLRNGKSSKQMAEEAIRECRRVGIITVGAIILDAFGDETVQEIEQMILWATEWLDFAQFSLVAALPGCAMRRKALRDHKIINQGHENWEHYDGAHPTIKHSLSPIIRRQLWHKAYVDFTRLDHVLRRAGRAQGLFCKTGLLLGGLRYHQEIPPI